MITKLKTRNYITKKPQMMMKQNTYIQDLSKGKGREKVRYVLYHYPEKGKFRILGYTRLPSKIIVHFDGIHQHVNALY